MKKLILSTVLLILAQTAFLQKTETRPTHEMTKLVVMGKTFTAFLIPSTENKVELSSKDIGLDKILVTETNGELKLSVKGIFNTGNVTANIYCTKIPAVIVSDNGALIKSTEKIVADQIELTTNSDGTIHLILESKNVTCHLNSGGDMTLEGSTQNLIANGNVNGVLRAEMMTVDNCTAKAYLGCELHMRVKDNIAYTIGTGGKVHVYKPYATNITGTDEAGGLIKE
jgi:hypothetical protein